MLSAFLTGVSAGTDEMGVFGAFKASKEWTPPSDPAVLKKLQRWQDQKIGLLIHWGPYSQWGIVESWTLVTTKHPWNKRPERFANLDDRTYMATYEKLATTFNPTKFDPDKWAKAAKQAGIKYVMTMTKHHDGFCMWDTKTTDYGITSQACPFHKNPRADTVKLMCDAFRKQKISSGLYFSKADWHSPYYWLPELGPGSGQGPNYVTPGQPDKWQKFKDFTWAQIEELMTKYGPQDVLWLDGGAVRPPDADIDMDGMAAMARKHQPGLIVVDRTVSGPNENYITPEGEIPNHYLPYPWETCMPMGTSWTWVPNDTFKSVGTLVRNLCRIVARNGNFLIGIGPDGNGEFDPVVYDRLKGIGDWLKTNGEAVYSTRPLDPYEQGNMVFTRKRDGTVFAIVLAQNDDESLPATLKIPVDRIGKRTKASLLGYGDVKIGPDGAIEIPREIQTKSKGGLAWAFRLN